MFSDIVAHVYQGEEEEGAEVHGQVDDGGAAVTFEHVERGLIGFVVADPEYCNACE